MRSSLLLALVLCVGAGGCVISGDRQRVAYAVNGAVMLAGLGLMSGEVACGGSGGGSDSGDGSVSGEDIVAASFQAGMCGGLQLVTVLLGMGMVVGGGGGMLGTLYANRSAERDVEVINPVPFPLAEPSAPPSAPAPSLVFMPPGATTPRPSAPGVAPGAVSADGATQWQCGALDRAIAAESNPGLRFRLIQRKRAECLGR